MPHLPALRLATAADLKFLAAHDRHLPVERLSATIRAGHVLVVDGAEGILGWLRWGLFWDEIPFMNMLFVLEPARGRGDVVHGDVGDYRPIDDDPSCTAR